MPPPPSTKAALEKWINDLAPETNDGHDPYCFMHTIKEDGSCFVAGSTIYIPSTIEEVVAQFETAISGISLKPFFKIKQSGRAERGQHLWCITEALLGETVDINQGDHHLHLKVQKEVTNAKMEEAVRLLQWFRRAHVSLLSLRTCVKKKATISMVD